MIVRNKYGNRSSSNFIYPFQITSPYKQPLCVRSASYSASIIILFRRYRLRINKDMARVPIELFCNYAWHTGKIPLQHASSLGGKSCIPCMKPLYRAIAVPKEVSPKQAVSISYIFWAVFTNLCIFYTYVYQNNPPLFDRIKYICVYIYIF